MKRATTSRRLARPIGRRGTVLVLVMAVVAGVSLLGTGLVNLSAANAVETAQAGNHLQAFWAAEAGLQEVLSVARTPQPGIVQLRDSIGVGTGVWTGSVGRASYSVDIVQNLAGWYTITSTGSARGGAQRRVQLEARAQGFGTDGWETDSEGNIYFGTGDVLNMRVYSNDDFNIWGTPRFMKQVSTSASTVNYQNPYRDPSSTDATVFQAGLNKGASRLDFQTDHVTAVRNCATVSLTGVYRIVFRTTGGFTYQLRNGGVWGPPQTNNSATASIYVSGDSEVSGMVNGSYTVASGGAITIPSTGVRYESASSPHPDPHESNAFSESAVNDVLGLVSATAVRIDGSGTDQDSDGEREVPVHAAVLVADGAEGFTTVLKYSAIGQPKLEVFGALSQANRGVVGTVGGAGYLKHYIHDGNLRDRQPPCWPQRGYEVAIWRQSP